MHLLTALIVFAAVFLAELPDKTAIAGLVLGARYRSSWVLTGMAAAFAVHVALAVTAGSLLRLLPHRPLAALVAALFVLGAVLLLREGRHEPSVESAGQPPAGLGPLRVVATSFGVIFVAEFGDLTQILTADLAARYHDPLAVAVGAVLALWSVGGLAVLGGRTLLARIPLRLTTRIAAAVLLVLGAYSLVTALRP